jgi:hypothetical protein
LEKGHRKEEESSAIASADKFLKKPTRNENRDHRKPGDTIAKSMWVRTTPERPLRLLSVVLFFGFCVFWVAPSGVESSPGGEIYS